mmetsp:Transcript_40834/g.127892  ORF Transcript_40834/g.127892 Transcript_40834/m.127892 type:complete len:222 (-) Transcript_40834:606-1271(-)
MAARAYARCAAAATAGSIFSCAPSLDSEMDNPAKVFLAEFAVDGDTSGDTSGVTSLAPFGLTSFIRWAAEFSLDEFLRFWDSRLDGLSLLGVFSSAFAAAAFAAAAAAADREGFGPFAAMTMACMPASTFARTSAALADSMPGDFRTKRGSVSSESVSPSVSMPSVGVGSVSRPRPKSVFGVIGVIEKPSLRRSRVPPIQSSGVRGGDTLRPPSPLILVNW